MDSRFVETTTAGNTQISDEKRSYRRVVEQAEEVTPIGLREARFEELCHTAWHIIANVAWEDQTGEWVEAAERFRERFHAMLSYDTASARLTSELKPLVDSYGAAGVKEVVDILGHLEEIDNAINASPGRSVRPAV